MAYIDSNLMPDEKVVYKTRLHWTIALRSILTVLAGLTLFVASLLAGDLAGDTELLAMGLLIVAGLALVMSLFSGLRAFIIYRSSEFGITTKRVIIKTGVFHRQTLELMLRQVEAISVDQTFTGRMLGFGSLTLTGTGGVREEFHRIKAPLEFRKQIQIQAG
jgi:uncharacterized membrane protein YdbT with pleckstrin-like domain